MRCIGIEFTPEKVTMFTIKVGSGLHITIGQNIEKSSVKTNIWAIHHHYRHQCDHDPMVVSCHQCRYRSDEFKRYWIEC